MEKGKRMSKDFEKEFEKEMQKLHGEKVQVQMNLAKKEKNKIEQEKIAELMKRDKDYCKISFEKDIEAGTDDIMFAGTELNIKAGFLALIDKFAEMNKQDMLELLKEFYTVAMLRKGVEYMEDMFKDLF